MSIHTQNLTTWTNLATAIWEILCTFWTEVRIAITIHYTGNKILNHGRGCLLAIHAYTIHCGLEGHLSITYTYNMYQGVDISRDGLGIPIIRFNIILYEQPNISEQTN